jgi:hypothetical protein
MEVPVGTSKKVSERAHGALHRLPGMPAHDRAAELNSNRAAAARHHRQLANRPVRNRPLQDLGRRPGRPPRVLPGWQAWIGRLFGAGQQ